MHFSANEDHNEVLPHTVRMTIIKKLQTINAEEGMEKSEPSYTVGGHVNWYSHCGEQYGDFFKN